KIALLFRDRVERRVEDLRRRDAMQIRARIEGVNKTAIAGKLRENPQLDLRVVSDDQLPLLRMTAETPAILNRVRHLLNVWIRACKTPGRRADLPEVRMQTFRDGIDHVDH